MKSEAYGINAHDVYGLHKHIKYIGDEIVRRLDEMRKYTISIGCGMAKLVIGLGHSPAQRRVPKYQYPKSLSFLDMT